MKIQGDWTGFQVNVGTWRFALFPAEWTLGVFTMPTARDTVSTTICVGPLRFGWEL